MMASPKTQLENANRSARLEEYAREEAKKPRYSRVVVTKDGEIWRYLKTGR